ncbi:hypothetical protein CG018_07535 [Gemella sp. ND 6198]|uniref:HK97 gp10 family phage protein n=1 Tax=Gemella sp. ND 6198 TaxID=2040624 RepID=UPI000E0BDB75|nr:HK97 gp10 family phage protein [Gemella sp. ND 6198]AXI27263.1 hypothetical protein CG018_07535 [Gemella sp. ND 6198]
MSNIISIGISDFGLQEYLETYPLKVHIIADKAAYKAAKEGRALLLVTSPVKSGRYARGWSVRNNTTVASGIEYVVHNKNSPYSVHLLEDGHEMFIRGVYTGKRVAGIPHFEKAKEKAGDLFEQYFDDGLRSLD